MKHALRGFGFSIACLLLTGASTFAQISTAQLGGRVTDQQGAIVQGASVTARQLDTGYARNDLTDANGSYLLSNLPPGPYQLQISLRGFRTNVQKGIVLHVATSKVIDAMLMVGALERPSSSRQPGLSSTRSLRAYARSSVTNRFWRYRSTVVIPSSS